MSEQNIVDNQTNILFSDYFDMSANYSINPTEREEILPESIKEREIGFVVAMYCLLLVTGALGNVAVFLSLVRSRRRKSRVNLLMTHLAVADLIITFLVIPLEIFWKTTNAWLAGNIACKFFLVIRAFGFYLSSNVLVCISLDRFFAVLYPLRLPIARKRSKIMLYFAWLTALICSLPQSVVFRVLSHPVYPDFQQCVSFGAFTSHNQELAYNVFCLSGMYFLPLLFITVCYACIFYEISKNSQEISGKERSISSADHSKIQLRRSDERPLARARRRTLRMTITIVTVFALCWLPYAVMTLWYMIDRQSAQHVSAKLQDVFFIMAVSNACMDPLVYGSYAMDLKSLITNTMTKVFFLRHSPSKITAQVPTTMQTKLVNNGVQLKTKFQLQDILHCVRINEQKVDEAAERVLNGCLTLLREVVNTVNQECPRRVHFEETSMVGHSAISDPIPCSYKSSSRESMSHNYKLKQWLSCELLTLEIPKTDLHVQC